MKITKISVHLDDIFGHLVISALTAAFSPFGSLTEGVDGKALAEAMARWVNVKREDQLELANELIRLVWAAKTDQLSTVEFGSGEVSLRTPTSGTRIILDRSGGEYNVEVDFGVNGSESRAMVILAAAERSGVQFYVYDGEEYIEYSDVLSALLQQVEGRPAWLERLEGHYSEEYKAKALARAREAVAFFKNATA